MLFVDVNCGRNGTIIGRKERRQRWMKIFLEGEVWTTMVISFTEAKNMEVVVSAHFKI